MPLEGARDAERLEVIFQELAAIKDDSQQRSWFLHEDEASICNHLEELMSIIVRSFLFIWNYDKYCFSILYLSKWAQNVFYLLSATGT